MRELDLSLPLVRGARGYCVAAVSSSHEQISGQAAPLWCCIATAAALRLFCRWAAAEHRRLRMP